MKTTTTYKLIAFLLFMVAYFAPEAVFAVSPPVDSPPMQNYCVVPPSIRKDVKPNILIIMDNSELNGLPAFKSTISGIAQVYDKTKKYEGYFLSDVHYTYASNEFTPDLAAGVFDGNFLNWVATSRYDIIQSVIVGGISTSRQTNVNKLLGLNAGDWEEKYYIYTGSDGETYACLIEVNADGRSNLTISDSPTYFMDPYGWRCGLILSPRVGPAAAEFYTASVPADDSTMLAQVAEPQQASPQQAIPASPVALAPQKAAPAVSVATSQAQKAQPGSTPASTKTEPKDETLTASVFNFINDMVSGSTARDEALAGKAPSCSAPSISIYNPNDNAVFNLTLYTAMTNYTVQATGLTAKDEAVCGTYSYSWTAATGLPPGITFGGWTCTKGVTGSNFNGSWACSGTLSGTPTAAGSYPASSINLTLYKTAVGSAGASSSSPATITDTVPFSFNVVDTSVTILLPANLQSLTDVAQGGAVTPFITLASGGNYALPYDWTMTVQDPSGVVMATPPFVIMDNADGSGTIGGNYDVAGDVAAMGGYVHSTTALGTYTLTITLTNGGNTKTITAYVKVVKGTPSNALQITTPTNGAVLEPVQLRDGQTATAFTGFQSVATGGTPSYTWSVAVKDSLGVATDIGLKIRSGVGADTPGGYLYGNIVGAAGTYDVEVTATDSKGDTYTRTATITISINPLQLTWPAATFPTPFYVGRIAYKDSGISAPEYDKWFEPIVQGGTGKYKWVWSYAGAGWPLSGTFAMDPDTGIVSGHLSPATSTTKIYDPVTVTVCECYDAACVSLGSCDKKNIRFWTDVPKRAEIFDDSSASWVTNAADGESMPTATQGEPYGGYALTTRYGYGQLKWFASGLPLGLEIDSDSGTIKGTTNAPPGDYLIDIWINDPNHPTDPANTTYCETAYPGSTYTPIYEPGALPTDPPILTNPQVNCIVKNLKLTVVAAPVVVSSLTLVSPIADEVLPVGNDRYPYVGYQAMATGGTTPYVWTATGLPAGMTINAATGKISDIPAVDVAVATTYNVQVKVTDAALTVKFANVTLTINPADTLTINAPQVTANCGSADANDLCLPDGTESILYAGGLYGGYQSTASGGVNNSYTWSMVVKDINGVVTDIGLTIDALTGVISGTPATGTSCNKQPTACRPADLPAAGYQPYTVTITVTDGSGRPPATVTVTLNVLPPPDLTLASEDFNVAVCAGDYVNNCDMGTYVKHGLLQDYFDRADFGFEDFNSQEDPNVGQCPDGVVTWPSFYTAVQNAVPQNVTKLPNGIYEGLRMYMLDAETVNNCDPYLRDVGGTDVLQGCKTNFILMLTGGEGVDTPPAPSPWAAGCDFGSDATLPKVFGRCKDSSFSKWPALSAAAAVLPGICETKPDGTARSGIARDTCYGYYTDMVDESVAAYNLYVGKQNVSTYIVNAMGVCLRPGDNRACTSSNVNLYPEGAFDPKYLALKDAASVSRGEYYYASNATELRENLKRAFQEILKRAASGTAASVLASGEGTGANLIQAVYYPRAEFKDLATNTYKPIDWIGKLSSYWYYVDPKFASSNIREDTDVDTTTLTVKTMDVKKDRGMQLDFLTLAELKATPFYTADGGERNPGEPWEGDRVYAYFAKDTDGNGIPETEDGQDYYEYAKPVWEAGLELWKRDLASAVRRIYTYPIPAVGTIANNLLSVPQNDTTFSANIVPYLNVIDGTEARNVIRFTFGFEIPGYRSRLVKIDVNGDGDMTDKFDGNYDGDTTDAGDADESVARTWKLGDVLNSTPKLFTWVARSKWDQTYDDATYKQFTTDTTDTGAAAVIVPGTKKYKERGMILAGANDGMLHAFRLGKYEIQWTGQAAQEKARLLAPSGDFGKELWAYIPKNALPYLKYMAHPGYCHMYTNDLTPYVLDVSIGDTSVDDDLYYTKAKSRDTWRTVALGGMRFGGGCVDASDSCSEDVNNDGVVDDKDCIKTPIPGVGYSTYFALDVTDYSTPRLLWEITDPVVLQQLGNSTTGPVVVRVSPPDDKDMPTSKNGRWFAVVGSGPTGPIDTARQQYLGFSNQNLKLFVFDLRTGELLRTIDTGIPDAFAGSFYNITNDTDINYEDDVLYVGYTRRGPKDANNNEWIYGGMLRVLTRESIDPNDWVVTPLIQDVAGDTMMIGPVTGAPARIQDLTNGTMWTFLGTGRFFYRTRENYDSSVNNGSPLQDDEDSQRYIMGIIDPCYDGANQEFKASTDPTYASDCATPVNKNDLFDVTFAPQGVSTTHGWYIKLDPMGDRDIRDVDGTVLETVQCNSERMTSDMTVTSYGQLYGVTFSPFNDVCSLGGIPNLWAMYYATGGCLGAMLQGSAVLQFSTGEIKQVDLAEAFGYCPTGTVPLDETTDTPPSGPSGGYEEESHGGRTPTYTLSTGEIGGAGTFQVPAPPVERVLHVIEKVK